MRGYGQLGLLVVILFLGVCYGQEKANRATQEVALARLADEAAGLAAISASRLADLSSATRRADSLERVVHRAAQRRGRAVASSDSVLVRVDSVLSSPVGSAASPETPHTLTLLSDLRASLLAERGASTLVIASLEQTVVAQTVALAAADSVIVAQGREISTLRQTLAVARQRPPWYRAFVSGATKVLVGVAIGAIVAR